MALNQQSILAEYEAAKAEALKAQKGFGSQQTPSTFEAQLSGAMLGREIAPNIATQERMLMKQFMTSPSEVSTRLGGVVSPLQESQLIGQQRGVLMDQLNSLADLRTNKRQELKDIIASTALGYKAQYEKEKNTLDMAKDKMDTSWKEYQEAVRQQEHAETLSQSTAYKKNIKNQLIQEQAEYIKSRAVAEGDPWDGFMGADKWMTMRQKAGALLGYEGTEWWEENYPLYKEVNPTESNMNELKSSGLDFDQSLNDATLKVKIDFLKDTLSKTFTDEEFRSLKEEWSKYLPELTRNDNNETIQAFKDYIRANALIQGSSIENPEALIEELFPFVY